MLLKPNLSNHCFACGGSNTRGMQLTFEQDDQARRIRGMFRIGADFQGGAGFVHGGIIATLLDEAMAKVNRFNEDYAVTARLAVDYLKPVPVDEDLIVDGWETERNGRNLTRQAEIRDTSGVVLARGEGRFVQIGAERLQKSLRSP